MASGTWDIPLVATSASVDFIETTPDAIFVLDPNNPFSGTKTGSASIEFGGTGTINLDSVPFTLLTLPAGFQITSIDRVTSSGSEGPPGGFTSDSIQVGNREIPSWDTDFGWNQASAPLNDAAQVSMLTGFTFNGDFSQLNGSGFAWTISGPDNMPAPVQTGAWDDLGDVVTPGTPEVEITGPGEIEVTPGPGTTIIIVEVPGNPEIIVPVTPGVPVVVPVPPGGPITVTPVAFPPFAPGTPVVVGDLTVEGDLVIDVALNFTTRYVRDPSGIYTLVPGQFKDILYEHTSGTTTATSQTVSIPRPYGVTSYIPERD